MRTVPSCLPRRVVWICVSCPSVPEMSTPKLLLYVSVVDVTWCNFSKKKGWLCPRSMCFQTPHNSHGFSVPGCTFEIISKGRASLWQQICQQPCSTLGQNSIGWKIITSNNLLMARTHFTPSCWMNFCPRFTMHYLDPDSRLCLRLLEGMPETKVSPNVVSPLWWMPLWQTSRLQSFLK